MNYDIFLSYSRQDRDWVIELANALRKKGLRVFDETEIKPGELVAEEMEEGLKESKYIIPIISTDKMQPNQAIELGVALVSKNPLIAVVDDNVPWDAIPGPIRRRQYLRKGEPIQVAEQIAQGISVGKTDNRKKKQTARGISAGKTNNRKKKQTA